MDEKKSILVIGGGPGGYVAAIKAAQLGADVTLIEKHKLGGTCLNVGCIPTKSLLHAADVIDGVRSAADFGIISDAPSFDWTKIQANRAAVVDRMVGGVGALMRANKIKVIEGTASFTDPHTVKAVTASGEEVSLTADSIIIATGSVPSLPRGSVADFANDPAFIDSTGALELDHVPERLAVIGGGVIGVELASVYNAFGTEVTILCSPRREHILPGMDQELAVMLESLLTAKGIKILPKCSVENVKRDGDTIELGGTAGEEAFTLKCDKVLMAAGRSANLTGLNIEASGVAVERGAVVVNDKMETNVPGIYAIGDCLGKVMLAHTASAQGETAAVNATGGNAVYDGTSNPSCVYTDPEFACVGLTEEKAAEKGIDYAVGRFPLMANGKSVIINGGLGMVKAIIDRADGRIIGMHILGPRATDIISECAFVVGTGATVHDMDGIIHAHPTVAEAVREAVLAADGRAINMPNRRRR